MVEDEENAKEGSKHEGEQSLVRGCCLKLKVRSSSGEREKEQAKIEGFDQRLQEKSSSTSSLRVK